MRFRLLATPLLSQLWVSTLEESRICRFLRAAVSPLLLLCVFSLLSAPGIAQARAGTAGVVAVEAPPGNPVNPPFQKDVTYTVKWETTNGEVVKDLHMEIDPDTTVSFNVVGGGEDIDITFNEADWKGSIGKNPGDTVRWINIIPVAGKPGAQTGTFTIKITGTEPREYTPIFTNDGLLWTSNTVTGVIPDSPTAKTIPFITKAGVWRVEDSNGNPAGTPGNPYRKGEEYTVKWKATEKIRDIHFRVGIGTTVDFNNMKQGDQDIEIGALGWTPDISGGWINLTLDPGVLEDEFKITINKGPLTLFEFRPIFTRDGDNWNINTPGAGVREDIVPNGNEALRIPFLKFTAVLEVDGLVAGAPATVHVANATPLGQVRLGYSLIGGGPVSTPWGLLLLSPPYSELPSLHADELGHAALTVPVPAGTAGVQVWFHALDIGSLTFTNGVAAVIL